MEIIPPGYKALQKSWAKMHKLYLSGQDREDATEDHVALFDKQDEDDVRIRIAKLYSSARARKVAESALRRMEG